MSARGSSEAHAGPDRHSYRADIDGLRALAVVPVVLYHAGATLFGGGFVGVDVFFVISGYLITQIIVAETAERRFTVGGFYLRRVRRILPALFAVMAFAIVAAFILFLPFEFYGFSLSVAATTAFGSNILFWLQGGYFDAPAHLKPLLHTWSLAVEEQYYIVFPLLMILLARWQRSVTVAVLALIAIASFAAAVLILPRHPEAVFYLAPYRAWEFLLGALLAVRPVKLTSRLAAEAVSWAGIAAIVASILLYSDQTLFPGVAALLPCLGATAIILGGNGVQTSAARVLSLRPVVITGLISYSLYLWHWPFIVFARAAGFSFGTLTFVTAIFVISFVAAWLSWRFVETPFRRRTPRIANRTVVLSAIAGAVIMLGAAAAGILTHGLPQRFSPEVRAVAAYLNYRGSPEYRTAYRAGTCFLEDEPFAHYDARTCFAADASRSKAILLWGDSHAAHYYPGLSAAAQARGYTLADASEAGCRPTIGIKGTPNCTAFRNGVMALIDKHPPAIVILSAYWRRSTQIAPYELTNLPNTIAALHKRGITVFVIGPSLEYREAVPVLLTDYVASHGKTDTNSFVEPAIFTLDNTLRGIVAKTNAATYVSVLDIQCPQHKCPVPLANGKPAIWDLAHLTKDGSVAIGPKLFKAMLR